MNILIVKLSSLGDVVHAMPAVQDIRRAVPLARIDWVVERAFAPLVERLEGVRRAIPCELRKWRKAPLARETRHEWRAFRRDLQQEPYDAVIDLQGLTKSALVARVARVTREGKRYALANRTEGSSYEAPTRWVADTSFTIEPRTHAVQRSRELCAKALAYAVPDVLRFGLVARGTHAGEGIAFIHGTSRADKLWPEDQWVALGRQLIARGERIALPHGNDEEEARSRRLADALGPAAEVWPRLPLDALVDRLAGCSGAIGVDSGLSHIAVALDLPHVQIYNFETAWRTGPAAMHQVARDTRDRQRSVYSPDSPTVDEVAQAWKQVTMRPE